MSSTQMPPVPDGLREMLKAYPGHIERLQQELNWMIENPASGVPPFERAIWLIEGCLETFISEARDEFETANSGGDAAAIVQADRKLELMFGCRSRSVWKARNLLRYFDDMEIGGIRNG